MSKPIHALIIGISVLILAIVLSLKFGSVSQADLELISQIRLPRLVLAIAVGAGLAVCGAALQAVFTNPLCDPYTLGISSGAALGSVIGVTFGTGYSIFGIAGTAFTGSMLVTGILYLMSLHRGAGKFSILLAGVMLGFLGSSFVALWMALADPSGIQGALTWLLGDLSRVNIFGALITFISVLALFFILMTQSRKLDALLLGEDAAQSLGVPTVVVRRRVILLTSMIVAVCVSTAGMIGFIGLIVPHFVRRYVGVQHTWTLPLCFIWGAIVLVVSDLISRTLFLPYEVPVGVMTSLIGAPLFIFILMRGGFRHES